MFYLVTGSYSPNTAPTNRIMAYVRALSELKISTRVIFFMPNKAHSTVKEEYPFIEFEYLWQKNYINIPRVNRLSLIFYRRQFIKQLKQDDIVYVYGFQDLVVDLSKVAGIKVYAERTEHDAVSFVYHIRKITVSDFLDACRRISGMVVISQPLREYYIENGCNSDRVHVVNMITDSTRFQGIIKENSEPYIAYCGTASNSKDGVDQLIKAFALTIKKHPEYKLCIIGSTPSKKEKFDNLDLVKELGIEHNVVFTGVVPANEMPQMLKNAEILALDRPDNMQAKYGFPTKLGEYLLTGNPVVLTNVGDIPLFLKDGDSALVAEPNNPNSFSEKLCWAIENKEKALEIGLNGKKVAETQFNYLTETSKIVNMISK